MKKVKILSVFALILCFCLLLVSCSSMKSVLSSKEYKAEDTKVFTTATAMGEYAGFNYNFLLSPCPLICLYSANQKVVYNFAEGKQVLSFTSNETTEYTIDFALCDVDDKDIPFIVVRKTTDMGTSMSYEYTLYNLNGQSQAVFTRKTNIGNVFQIINDLIIFDNIIYQVKADGSINKVGAKNELSANLPDFEVKCGDYYYDTSFDGVQVYNKHLEFVYRYDFPEYAVNPRTFVLNDGNVFVQYSVLKFNDDKKYTYVGTNAAGELIKYDLIQKVIDIKKGKEKDVKAKYYYDFIISRSTLPDAFNGIKKKIVNIASCSEIKDKRIQDDADQQKIVSLSNKGKIKKVLNDDFAGETFFQAISSNRVVVNDFANHSYLYDFKGKRIGEISNKQAMTSKFILSNKCIYNMDLNVVYNLEENGCACTGIIGDNIVIQGADGYYFVNGKGEPILLTSNAGSVTISDNANAMIVGVYDTTNNTTTYKVYNCEGQQINGVLSTSQMSFVTSDKGGVLVRYYDSTLAKYVYYAIH